MKDKKKQELTTDDAPDSIEPWEMLDDDGMAQITAKVIARYPEMNLKAFARRIDNDHRACFDKGADGTGKRVVVVREGGGPIVKDYVGFIAWFDSAIAESLKK